MRPRAVYSWLCWAAFLPSLQGEGGQVQDSLEGQDEGAGRPLEAFFTTQPRQEMVNEGGEIRLPCFVEDWGDFVLVWKFAAAFSNNSAIEDMTLSVGQRVIEERDQGRLRIDKERNGNWLVVAGAREEDEGRYTCMVSSFQPKSVEHRVMVRSRPVVAVGREVVQLVAGETGGVGCRVLAGRPLPELTWLDSGGRRVAEGAELELQGVTREQGGVYRCRGDNGYSSEGGLAEVVVVVEHAPELEGGRETVHSSQGGEVVLVCRVAAWPAAEVSWSSGGEELTEDSLQYRISGQGVEHQLAFNPPVAEELQEAEYSCRAVNSHGAATKIFFVTSKPSQPVFSPPIFSNDTDDISLQWRVASDLDILAVWLEVRGPQSFRLTETIDSPRDISGPFNSSDSSSVFEGVFSLGALVEGVRYRARAAATNSHGRGPMSDWFDFRTDSASSQPPRRNPPLGTVFLVALLSLLSRMCNVL